MIRKFKFEAEIYESLNVFRWRHAESWMQSGLNFIWRNGSSWGAATG
jgi:hypothetical protein